LQTKATHAISIFLSNCWSAMDIVASAGLPRLGSVRRRTRLLRRRHRCSAVAPVPAPAPAADQATAAAVAAGGTAGGKKTRRETRARSPLGQARVTVSLSPSPRHCAVGRVVSSVGRVWFVAGWPGPRLVRGGPVRPSAGTRPRGWPRLVREKRFAAAAAARRKAGAGLRGFGGNCQATLNCLLNAHRES